MNKNDYKPYRTVKVPNGEKNSEIAKDLQFFCFCTVKKLANILYKWMQNQGYNVEVGKNYLYFEQEGKYKDILLTAHIDTVQDKKGAGEIYVEYKNNKHYLWSPKGIGGDDRCGILAIKRLIEKGYKPSVLICDKEETGGDGSEEFCRKYKGKTNYKCILELDRQGSNDLVFYDEDNSKWKKWLEKITGWKEANGTFSDICNLYDLGSASVNLSVGYYHQHTKDEYIVLEELENSILVVEKIITSITKKYKHIERSFGFVYYGRNYDIGYYNPSFYDRSVGGFYSPSKRKDKTTISNSIQKYKKLKLFGLNYINKLGAFDYEELYAFDEEDAKLQLLQCYDIPLKDVIDAKEINASSDEDYQEEMCSSPQL